MTDYVWTEGVTNHFVTRAVQRMGCTAEEAREIGQFLIRAIEREQWDAVSFIGRVNGDGHRIFRFKWKPLGRYWYALINTETMTCITVLKPGFEVQRQGKGRLKLREVDI
jgi:hypothetical protein